MSQLQLPTKGPRKRASSEALRDNMPRRMKLADAPIGKEVADLPMEIEVTDKSEREMDISDIKAEIERIYEERRNAEKQAKEEGRRVEKRTR